MDRKGNNVEKKGTHKGCEKRDTNGGKNNIEKVDKGTNTVCNHPSLHRKYR